MRSKGLLVLGVLLIAASVVLFTLSPSAGDGAALSPSATPAAESLLTATAQPSATPPRQAAMAGPTSPDLLTGQLARQLAATPQPVRPQAPERLIIPAIGLDAPVVISPKESVQVNGQTFYQWRPPDAFAAGWQEGSALLGEAGNTVLNGHHNIFGEVFGRLVDLKIGDFIEVDSRSYRFTYVIANRMIVAERDQTIGTRMLNARWILPSDDERLTLVTCWPKTNNTHRLIIVARPVSAEPLSSAP
jgi:sortase A